MWLLGIPVSVSATEVLISLAVFCLLFLVLQTFQKQIPRGLKRIPGPRGYPLIGNLLEVGTDVHLSLTQMSKAYGDVMMIHLGTKPILVLSGLETIKEALVRHGEDFKGRPDLHTFRHVADGQSLSFSTDSGPVWVARRKLAQHALKTFASSPSLTSSSTCLLEDHVSEEAHHLMAKLQEVMLAKNRLDPYVYLTIAVANVVLAMCFGRRYDYDDEELLNIVINSEQFVESTGSGSLATFIPFLQYLPNSKDHIRDITDSLIEESQKQKADAKAKIQLPPGKIVNLKRNSWKHLAKAHPGEIPWKSEDEMELFQSHCVPFVCVCVCVCCYRFQHSVHQLVLVSYVPHHLSRNSEKDPGRNREDDVCVGQKPKPGLCPRNPDQHRCFLPTAPSLQNPATDPSRVKGSKGEGYPLIGNILDLGKNPHLALTGLSQKYGDVMLIHLGARPVVVLSGLETIKQALVKQGGDFVGRPDLYSFQFINEGQTFTFGWNSEESWRVRRRLAQSALKTFAGSTSPNSSTCLLEDHISKEAEYLVTKFRDQMKEKESFEPFQYVVISVVNVICAMCFGRRYDHEDQELLKIVDINNDFGMVAASGNPADFFPILRYLPSRSMEAFKDLNRRFNVLMKKLNNIRDITDSLISFCQDKTKLQCQMP
ncbi:hypothetical protein E2320_013337 [Naja naja]|nr:hypothetical protein E2320_013337 [Naja naja]